MDGVESKCKEGLGHFVLMRGVATGVPCGV